MEKSLAAFEERLASAELSINDSEPNEDALEDLLTRFDEAESKLNSFKEDVRFHEDKVSEQSNQLLEKDAPFIGYHGRVVFLEQGLAGVPDDVKRLTAQQTASNDPLDSIHTALALHKTAPQ